MLYALSLSICLEIRKLSKRALTEIHARLKENGSVLRELMFESHSQTMSLAACLVCSVLVIQKAASVIKISDSRAFLDDISDIAAVHIVSGQLHIAVEKVKSTVKASHPGCGDTVATAPAAHSTTHSAATATHALHHTAGHIIETAVVCIVSIKDYADLAFISKSSDHCRALITSVIHI